MHHKYIWQCEFYSTTVTNLKTVSDLKVKIGELMSTPVSCAGNQLEIS